MNNEQNEKQIKRGRGKYAYRFTICILFLLIAAALVTEWYRKKSEPLQKTGFLLDTVISITLYDSRDQSVLDGAYDLCAEYEQKLSPTITTSDIYRMNHRASGENTCTPDPDVLEVIRKGLEYSEKTDGAFDITVEPLSSLWDFKTENPSVPDAGKLAAAAARVDWRKLKIDGDRLVFAEDGIQVDPGAVAKGYIADRIKDYLVSRGIRSAIINLGGNVLCVGRKPNGKPFVIGLQKPYADHTETVKELQIDGLSVVSSGVYERHFVLNGVNYHHILNPRTGMPYENGITGVSIIGPESAECDALSTSCFSLGTEKGMQLLDGTEGYYGYFILDDGTILPSGQAPA